jgi:hypothetical protein
MFSATSTSNNNNNNNSNTPPGSSVQFLNSIPTKLNNVDSSHHQKPVQMPSGYIPSDFDVCSGRGKQNWNASGNVKFRKLIHMSVDRYLAAPFKSDKTAIVVSIVSQIRQLQGHFLKQHGTNENSNKGSWYDIGDAAAREKVGHSLRDQVGSAANAGRPKCKSPLHQAKKRTRHAAATVTVTATTTAGGECDSFDADTAATAGLPETLPSSATDDEMSDASIQPATLRRASSLVFSQSHSDFLGYIDASSIPVSTILRGGSSSPLDMNNAVWSSDLLPTSLNQLLSISDFLGYFDFY